MEYLTNAFAFVVVLGVMIFFHEFGHFITAKLFGMRVFIFSFGFGTRLVGFKWGDTDCRISAIPLGGYVKLEGEPDDKLSEDTSLVGDGKDFGARPRWQRFLVYLAGPIMNFVLTIGVMAALFVIGVEVDAALQDRPVVGYVEPGSPAARGGLQPGDEIVEIDGQRVDKWEDTRIGILIRPNQATRIKVARGGRHEDLVVDVASTADKMGSIGIQPLLRIGITKDLESRPAARAGVRHGDAVLAIDGQPVKTFDDIVRLVTAASGRPVRLQVLRDGQQQEFQVTPQDEGAGPKIGLGGYTVLRKYPLGEAVRESVSWTWKQVVLTVEVLKRLVTAQLSPKTMMGPLGIAKASGEAARGGAVPLALLVAIISLQIGIMNLLPVPPLDGGHLAIIAGEGLLRRDFSQDVKVWIMNAGAIALFLLIGLVLYSDLSKTSLLGRYLP
jgi:regulator of sigma E protease